MFVNIYLLKILRFIAMKTFLKSLYSSVNIFNSENKRNKKNNNHIF